jgi:rod shape-determining protein MreD
VSILLTGLALALALVVQSGLSLAGPPVAHVLDPFMIVLVYVGLRDGETQGMLAGAAAGWLQDLHFGGPVVGLSGLSKIVVGFCVGLAGGRLLLTGNAERLLVVLSAALMDGLVLERLLSVFDLPSSELTLSLLLIRAVTTALVGAAIYSLVDRRFAGKARR